MSRHELSMESSDFKELLSTLDRLEVKAASWENNDSGPQINEDGLPSYLTSIVASKLAWIEEEVIREQIWEAASVRLSERSGRSGLLPDAPFYEVFVIPAPDYLESVSITLHEPSLTADNLGHKTWLASFLLAKRMSSLIPHLPALQFVEDDLEPPPNTEIIELGAGTGLVGLAIAAMYPVHVHLTDLPEIVPNLRSNVLTYQRDPKFSSAGTATVGELDWSQHAGTSHYDLVLAADPIYSPQHPAWLVSTIESVLKRDEKARVVIELPLREAYNAEVEELKSRMAKVGLLVIAEGLESGFEDWESAQDPTERIKVQCWWAILRWSIFPFPPDAIVTAPSNDAHHHLELGGFARLAAFLSIGSKRKVRGAYQGSQTASKALGSFIEALRNDLRLLNSSPVAFVDITTIGGEVKQLPSLFKTSSLHFTTTIASEVKQLRSLFKTSSLHYLSPQCGVFVLLVMEMSIFMLLIVPLPYTMKRKLFTFISENPLVAKLQYGMKITFIFILILFIDSVNRVYRVQVELSMSKNQGGAAAAVAGSERMEVQARKFYSQRNMYLCGFTLFLSLILNRTYSLILDTLRLEEKVKRYEGDPKAQGKDSKRLEQAGGAGEIGSLKNQLAQKDRELEAMKKQSEGLSREYHNLGDQMTQQDGTPKKDR
ncbi:MAG: hypothetical protein Q9212_002014 [Teloschistes hypoglaucus]